MRTKRYRITKRNKSRRIKGGKSKTGKKWTSAIESATKALKKTGSVQAARTALRKQSLKNARSLFGSL